MHANHSTIAAKRPTPRLLALIGAVVALALTAAACGDGAGDDALDLSSPTETSIGANTTETSPGDTSPGETTTSEPDTDPTVDDSGDGGEDRPASSPFECSLDQLGIEPVRMVAGIAADDPDGGLNLRERPVDGDVVATLPNGSLVAVETCEVLESGAVWYVVIGDEADQWGYANAAYLTEEIPADRATQGGPEAEALVIEFLDAVAEQRWNDAAALQPPSFDEAPGVAGDLLAQWCEARICDAPYEIVDVRGSHVPTFVTPEVDVRFDYPAGSSVQTFTPGRWDNGSYIVTLPGRSALAMTAMATASDLAGDASLNDEDQDLLAAAEAVRQALLSEDGPGLAGQLVADDGLVVSLDAYLSIGQASYDDVSLTVDDLADGDQHIIWGYQGGTGWPVVSTIDERLARYRRADALLTPDAVGIDEPVGSSTVINNVTEVLPQARYVEFHYEGSERYDGLDWSSTIMAFELNDGQWELVALVDNQWEP
jgi:hypothetical protein